MRKAWGVYIALGLLFLAGSVLAQITRPRPFKAQGAYDVEQFRRGWRVLDPITRRNLSVYPVVSTLKADTSEFLTLDDGLASGQVRIAKRGQVEGGLIRRRDPRRWPGSQGSIPEVGGPAVDLGETLPPGQTEASQRVRRWPGGQQTIGVGGPSVNELVLVNESARPLILLAGELVSGGKQNRIIGADLVVPPKSDPIPLNVFCVEQGRWSAGGGGFGTGAGGAMAHPEVRKEAQVNRSQSGVWASVAKSADALGAPSPTGDYAAVWNSARANRELEEMATSIESGYERELDEKLGGQDAVGVVVAINGELVWIDVFPSPELFRKYWPRLLRSYVMEARGRPRDAKSVPSAKEAEAFLLESRGHVTIQMEPAAYRRTEISTHDYQIVALEALAEFKDCQGKVRSSGGR